MKDVHPLVAPHPPRRSPAAGSIVVGLTSGWTRHVHRHGRAIAFAAAAWGVAIVAFGLADVLWLAVACLAAARGVDAIGGIFRSAIWNETIPDHLRGRLAGVEMISWSSGPTLGNAEAGAVAALAGVRVGHRRRRGVRGGDRRPRARAAALLALRQPRRGRCPRLSGEHHGWPA
jgi:MFS family permease